jgi:hypothetical protein
VERLARAATIAPTESGQQQEEDLVQQLRRAVTAQVELRHGIEDLARDLELD